MQSQIKKISCEGILYLSSIFILLLDSCSLFFRGKIQDIYIKIELHEKNNRKQKKIIISIINMINITKNINIINIIINTNYVNHKSHENHINYINYTNQIFMAQ